jgi:hypothetical protein
MPSAITRLMAVAAVAAAALLLVAALSVARHVPSSGTSSSATVRPATPTTHTVASASRFAPHGRRWI